VARVAFTHFDRVFWPEAGLRKRDLIEYYGALAPVLVPTETRVDRREGIYVDVKMNGHGQQVVAGYSVRPLRGAPVATPLRWGELDEALDPRALDLTSVPDRVARLGDLHAGLLHGRQRLPA
jgi:bifunctional non-homologous end joining protein LigD